MRGAASHERQRERRRGLDDCPRHPCLPAQPPLRRYGACGDIERYHVVRVKGLTTKAGNATAPINSVK